MDDQKFRKLKNSELGRLTADEFRRAAKTPISLILDNIRSLNNIGSVFRTADAFRLEKIYLCGITATPPHKDIQKTALGATESMDWEYAGDTLKLIQSLQKKGTVVISIEQSENSIPLDELSLEEGKSYALVFGNEVKGISQDVVSASDMVCEIPQYGTKHSLNIAVSAGVVIWDVFCKLRKQA